MSATSICFGLLILVFATLPLQRMHKKAETGGSPITKDVPHLAVVLLITSRPNPRCLECGMASGAKR
jgi:hypothetical protein